MAKVAVARNARMHAREPHGGSVAGRLNWLRAGVLGANDGIISTAGLVIGVAAATVNRTEIATAGVAGLVAGAVSMALGEFVSVSSQRDSERALIDKERGELERMPEAERAELVGLLEETGLGKENAAAAADDLTAADPLRAHLRLELGIDQHELTNPWVAAASSAMAFTVGAALPLAAILLSPASTRIGFTFAAVVVSLFAAGWASAVLGRAPKRVAIVRLVVGGALAMLVTFGVGHLVGSATG
jgi:VIT1/CCC1 family predicted Fe2+/Mn2+ transporter